jgi:hypothetical protein
LIENLGFVPEDIQIPAVEISRHLNSHSASNKYPQLTGFTLIKGGDAHRLEELTGANIFMVESRSLNEIKLALSGYSERKVVIND